MDPVVLLQDIGRHYEAIIRVNSQSGKVPAGAERSKRIQKDPKGLMKVMDPQHIQVMSMFC